MNKEDLCKGRTLLLLLNPKGRDPRIAFLFADIESARIGQSTGALIAASLPEGYYMTLEGNSPDTYGKIILKNKGPDLTDASYPTLPHLPPLKIENSEWRYVHLLVAQAPYTLPQPAGLSKIKELVDTRLLAAKDHIFSLREDPGCFIDSVKDWREHYYYKLPKDTRYVALAEIPRILSSG